MKINEYNNKTISQIEQKCEKTIEIAFTDGSQLEICVWGDGQLYCDLNVVNKNTDEYKAKDGSTHTSFFGALWRNWQYWSFMTAYDGLPGLCGLKWNSQTGKPERDRRG